MTGIFMAADLIEWDGIDLLARGHAKLRVFLQQTPMRSPKLLVDSRSQRNSPRTTKFKTTRLATPTATGTTRTSCGRAASLGYVDHWQTQQSAMDIRRCGDQTQESRRRKRLRLHRVAKV